MHNETGDYLIRISPQPYLEEAEKYVESIGLPEFLDKSSYESSADHIANMLEFVENELADSGDNEQTAAWFPFVDEAGKGKVILVWGQKVDQSTESSVTVHTPESLEEVVGLSEAFEA